MPAGPHSPDGSTETATAGQLPRERHGDARAAVAQGPPTAEVLVARMARGDEAALSQLYDRTCGRVFALALRILGDEADAGEVTLDVFTRAWSRAGEYDPNRGTVGTWLNVMARSKALDALRARRSREESIQRAGQAEPSDPAAMGQPPQGLSTETREMRRHIDQALAALTDDQRSAIELAYFHGLSQSQIAERVGAPLGTIKTRIRSAMHRLRDLLAPFYGDEVG